MNKFKKSSKSKSLTLGIAILSSAAIVSTGFAAWVIGGGAEASVNGTIEADTVIKREHTIAFASGVDQANLGSIFFGIPETNPTGTAYNWLGTEVNKDNKKEKLSVETTFTVANVAETLENTETSIKQIIDIEGTNKTRFEETTTTGDETKYSNLASKKYLAALPDVKLAGDGTSVGVHITFASKDDATKTATFNLKIVFRWGEHFNNGSPYVFYNSKDKNDLVPGTSGTTWKQDAETALGEISKMKANFKLTLVTK